MDHTIIGAPLDDEGTNKVQNGSDATVNFHCTIQETGKNEEDTTKNVTKLKKQCQSLPKYIGGGVFRIGVTMMMIECDMDKGFLRNSLNLYICRCVMSCHVMVFVTVWKQTRLAQDVVLDYERRNGNVGARPSHSHANTTHSLLTNSTPIMTQAEIGFKKVEKEAPRKIARVLRWRHEAMRARRQHAG